MSRESLCQRCFACQQGVDKSITVDTVAKGEMKNKKERFIWFVFPAGTTCNIACEYCFKVSSPSYVWTKEISDSILRFLFIQSKEKTFKVHFFGGEPMVMWDSIVDFVNLGNELAKVNGVDVQWGMTTNGTLLTKENLMWMKENFLKENPFLLSIDGRPETHNKYRKFPDGSGSYEKIPISLILELFPNIELRPTIMPDTTKDWFEDFRWLRNLGFKNIAIEPSYEDEWSDEQLKDYENTLRRLGEYHVYSVCAGFPIKMKWVDTVRSVLQGGESPRGRMCGVAFNSGGIDFKGLLYPCQRYACYNDEKYAIGDVWHGWDDFKRLKTMALLREFVRGDIAQGFNCVTCLARMACFKGCNAANLKNMSSRELVSPVFCKLTQIEVKIALEVMLHLGWSVPKRVESQCQVKGPTQDK